MFCGCSSVVEHHVANVRVVSSSLITRYFFIEDRSKESFLWNNKRLPNPQDWPQSFLTITSPSSSTADPPAASNTKSRLSPDSSKRPTEMQLKLSPRAS